MQGRALIFVLCILTTDSWCWTESSHTEGISVLIKAEGRVHKSVSNNKLCGNF